MSAHEHFYYPISRVNPEKREVEAVFFTSPRVRGDRFNLKYETIKRAATRYMEMPCIREMHQAKASGKALSIKWDDVKQTGTMVFRVVDDAAWEKVSEGVYRGLSIGGVPIICRGNDIEDFDWVETSMVDRPKDPGALFVVARAEDALAEFEPTLLPADASDEDVELARGEIEEKLERFEDALPLEVVEDEAIERYDHAQPRDDGGMWTIVAGHRISVSGKAVDHNDIHAAKAKFGLSDEATGALLAAHKSGKITTDQHLYRTLSQAEAKAGGLHALTTSHIASGAEHHGAGGSHENHWHSQAHGMAPVTGPGIGISPAIGAHELQKGDVVHFPAHDGKSTIAGVVHKVTPKHVDIGSTAGAAQVGVRVKKEHLKRPGFVRRDNQLHHVEVARFEEGDFERAETLDPMNEHAQAIADVLARVDEGDDENAVELVAERLREIARGEADSAIVGDEPIETDSAELERVYNPRQPRDDGGKWNDGAGGISAGHAVHVMKSEGIHEPHHHDEITAKIKSGKLKTREDVLKHIDSIHNGKVSDTQVLQALDHHGVTDKKLRVALLDAHDKGHVNSRAELHSILAHPKATTDHGHLVNAINLHGSGDDNYKDGGKSGDSGDAAKSSESKPNEAPKSGDSKPSQTPKNDDKPAKTDKGDAKTPEKAQKEAAKIKAEKKPGWQEKLKKLAKDTAHSFMNGYRKGRDMVGRAEGEADEIPALLDQFFDDLHDADDAQIARGLRAAIAQLDGSVERVITSETPSVPTRENLEGGKAQTGKSRLEQTIADLQTRLRETAGDEGAHTLIEEAIEAARRVLDGEVKRGEEAMSLAATEQSANETLSRLIADWKAKAE